MTDNELRAAWRKAGGGFFGPVIETAEMHESKLLPFLRSLIEDEREACALICDSHHDRARSAQGAARANACAISIRARGSK